MKSPFFWKNLCLVLLVVANFGLTVWLIWRYPRPAFTAGSVVGPVLLRTLSVMYATVAFLLVMFVVPEFCDAEFSEQAQTCWKRQRDWVRIQPGMTKTQVLEILGPAEYSDVWYDLDRNKYRLNPQQSDESASVSFSIVPTGSAEEAKVVEKYPADDRALAFDYFQTYSLDALKTHFSFMALPVSFIGIVLLALVSLLPVWPLTDSTSLSLYLPAAALVLCIAYETAQKGGWRFDLYMLFPAYGVIGVAWLLRVIHVAQK
jgi:hypothetical protein